MLLSKRSDSKKRNNNNNYFIFTYELLYFECFCMFFLYIFFSLRSFSQPVVFKTINDDDITYVENYVRNDLRELIESNENFNPEHKVFLFGQYAHNPEKFNFNRGEKKLLSALVQHVKNVTDHPTENDGLAIFNAKNNKKIISTFDTYLCATTIGTIFGRRSSIKFATKKEEGQDEMFKNLISKGKFLFDSFKLKECVPFSDDLFELKVDATKISGSIRCIFCDDAAVNKIVKVNRGYSINSSFWVMSNLKGHIMKCHISEPKKRQRKHQPATTNNANPLQIKDDVDDGVIDDLDHNATTIELEISPVASNSIENCDTTDVQDLIDQLHTQIWTQNVRLENMKQQNTETKSQFFVVDNGAIEVFPMDPNGDCVFSALAHQVFCVKIRSPDHQDLTRKLRKETVQFIKENFDSFEMELRGRVLENDLNEEAESIRNKCHDFLHHCLPEEKECWGGIESIKAISQMYQVNIVVINDDGTCNLPIRFHSKKTRTIMIGYSSAGDSNSRNHYDSIASISDFLMVKFSADLMKKEVQRQKFYDEAIQGMSIDLRD